MKRLDDALSCYEKSLQLSKDLAEDINEAMEAVEDVKSFIKY